MTAPAPGSFVADPNVHVTWSESDPVGTSTFDVWVSQPGCSTADGPAQTIAADPLQTDYGTDVTLDGGDGPHCITVVAHDVLGADPPGAEAAVTLDATPPSPPGSPDAGNPADQFPLLEWGPGTGDGGGSGVATYTVYRGGVAIHTEGVGDGSRRSFVDTTAGAGTTRYAITVTDGVGNESAPAPVEARYDGPSTQIVDHPTDPTSSPQATFTFTASEPGSFRCSVDDGAEADCTSPAALAGLADGDHAFHVHAVDQNGTEGPDQTFRWTVDTTAARLSLDGPSGLIDHADVSYTFTSDDHDATFTCRLDGDDAEACTSPKSYSLADGPHRVTVTETDSLGNVASDFRDVTVDTLAPTETFDQTPPASDTSDSATFAWHASEDQVDFECSLDGGTLRACNSPQTFDHLADGDHQLRVQGTDAAGNVGPFLTYPWTVDASAPDTRIDAGPNGPVDTGTPSFSFSSSDAAATFECSVDGAAFAACTSPATLGPLDDGGHTFQVRARDAAGNVDPTPAARSFTVDTVPPGTTITDEPASPTNDRTPAYGFSSDDPAATFECAVDGAAFAACQSGGALASLADGAHTFQVRARDAAGNVDPTPEARTLVVDTVAPHTTFSSGPPAHSASTTATFVFAADEPATFECRLDNEAFSACASGVSRSVDGGRHSFDVQATDAAGNVGPVASWDWTVDADAPNTTITNGPSGLTNVAAPSFAFEADDPDAGFECSLDGAAFAACTSPTGVGPLPDGQHTFQVRARDATGNVDPTPAQRTFTVDTAPPAARITDGPSGPTKDTTPTFAWSSPDGDATGFACSMDLPGGPFGPCPGDRTFGPLPNGDHTLYVEARDGAGNVGTAASRAFTVDTVPPTVTVDSGPSGRTSSQTASFTFHPSEAGSSLECRLDAAAYADCTSPQTYGGLADGDHTFSVRATDTAGNQGDPTSTGWQVDATAPDTLLDSGPTGRIADSTPTYAFHSSDPGATFECSVDDADFTACTSPAALGPLADGDHTFRVRAKDAAGNVDASPQTRAFTVDTLAPDTTIKSAPDHAVRQASFTFDSADAGATFQCAVDGADDADFTSCSSPKTVSGLSDGQHTFYVRAKDAVGNADPTPASRLFVLDSKAPGAAFLTTPSNPTNQTTATFTFRSDESDVTFGCQLDGSADTACDSGQSYPGLGPGNHLFRVRATDAAGNVGSYTEYPWKIDTSAPQLDITSGPPPATSQTSVTFAFTSPAVGATFTCKLDRTGNPGTAVPCFGAQTYNGLVESAYTFTVKVTTPAGNSSSASRAFIVDRTTPNGTFPALPAVSHGVVEFAAKPTDRGSPATGVASVTYTWAGPGGTSGTVGTSSKAPWTISWNTAGLPDGTYAVRAAPTDAAGNTGATTIQPVSTRLDNTGPSVELTVKPPVRGVFSVTATVNDPSKVVDVAFIARDAAGTVTTFAEPVGADLTSVTVEWRTGGTVVDGPYALQAVARDTLGNATASAPVPASVDNTFPSPPATPAAAASPTRAAPAISWPANQSTDIAGYDVYRGGQRVATLIGSTSFVDALATNGSQDGVYPYTVTAVDRAGNESLPSPPVTVVFDATAPAAPSALTPSGQNGTVTLAWPATADPIVGGIASGVAGYVVRRSVGAIAPGTVAAGEPVCTVAVAVTSCTDAGRALGVQLTYSVFAVDAAGNVSPGAAASFTPRAVVPQLPDRTPTAKASKLRATVKASRATVTWTNPKDADFDHVLVVINTRRAPRSPSDGTRVYRGKATRASFIGTAGTRTHVGIFAYDRTGNVTTAATVLVRFAPSLLQPLKGTVVNGSPKLSWKGVKGAAYYNVQVFQKVGRKRIAIAWPHGTSYRVPLGKLQKGKTYVWYVWPGYGTLKDARYGKLIGSSTFVYR